MLEKIINENLWKIISTKVGIKNLTELRLRAGKPIVAFMGNIPWFVCENGLTESLEKAIYFTYEEIQSIIFSASEFSIYAVNEEIKRGYLVLADATRIGVSGRVIIENDQIKTISNFTSINIRIPHQIKNCSLCCFKSLTSNGVKSTLVISPPGGGKTTFLRDFALQLSLTANPLNITILDERGEIAGGESGGLSTGNFTDILSFVPKKQGFEIATRTLAPDIIIADEIGTEEDANAVFSAFNAGIKIFASVHAGSLEELKHKPFLKKLIEENCFERYVLLSKKNGPGTFEGVFGKNFLRLGFGGEQ
ncbi:MAG: stage III sporulation protein AA [Clostridia bacterium]